MTGPSALVIVLFLGCQFAQAAEVCYGTNLCFSNDLWCWSSNPPSHPRSPDELNNHFYLYNRDNTQENKCNLLSTPQELLWNDSSSLAGFDAQLRTVVIIHGFDSNYSSNYYFGMCSALLEEFDVNVIMVDWYEAAKQGVWWWLLLYPVWYYRRARQDSRLVGREVGLLLELLHDHEELRYDDVHIVGHSLGAHLAGFAGEYLEGQVDRITGLDPAGPYFSPYLSTPAAECALDTSDARFVDVIHSDLNIHLHYLGLKFRPLGLGEAIGHQDFYVNRNDMWQPDCTGNPACNHERALDFFIASLKNYGNSSRGCNYPSTLCYSGQSSCSECPMMGIKANSSAAEGEYCVSTTCTNGFIKLVNGFIDWSNGFND